MFQILLQGTPRNETTDRKCFRYSSLCFGSRQWVWVKRIRTVRVDGESYSGILGSYAEMQLMMSAAWLCSHGLLLILCNVPQSLRYFTSSFCSLSGDSITSTRTHMHALILHKNIHATWQSKMACVLVFVCVFTCDPMLQIFYLSSPHPVISLSSSLSLQGCRMDEQRCPLPPPLKVSRKIVTSPHRPQSGKASVNGSHKPLLISCQTGFRVLTDWVRTPLGTRTAKSSAVLLP